MTSGGASHHSEGVRPARASAPFFGRSGPRAGALSPFALPLSRPDPQARVGTSLRAFDYLPLES